MEQRDKHLAQCTYIGVVLEMHSLAIGTLNILAVSLIVILLSGANVMKLIIH